MFNVTYQKLSHCVILYTDISLIYVTWIVTLISIVPYLLIISSCTICLPQFYTYTVTNQFHLFSIVLSDILVWQRCFHHYRSHVVNGSGPCCLLAYCGACVSSVAQQTCTSLFWATQYKVDIDQWSGQPMVHVHPWSVQHQAQVDPCWSGHPKIHEDLSSGHPRVPADLRSGQPMEYLGSLLVVVLSGSAPILGQHEI